MSTTSPPNLWLCEGYCQVPILPLAEAPILLPVFFNIDRLAIAIRVFSLYNTFRIVLLNSILPLFESCWAIPGVLKRFHCHLGVSTSTPSLTTFLNPMLPLFKVIFSFLCCCKFAIVLCVYSTSWPKNVEVHDSYPCNPLKLERMQFLVREESVDLQFQIQLSSLRVRSSTMFVRAFHLLTLGSLSGMVGKVSTVEFPRARLGVLNITLQAASTSFLITLVELVQLQILF